MRDEDIKNKRLSGMTLQEIGNLFNITRERVRQITASLGYKRPKKVKKSRIERRTELFFSNINKGNCWEWTGKKTKYGYGIFGFLGESYAHRVSWVIHNGEIPKEMFVLHKCDNPSCLNPSHLYLGNQTQNMKDRSERFAGKSTAIKNIPRREVK